MDIQCPACRQLIPSDSVNVGEGVAVCRECGKVWRLSELAKSAEDEAADRAAGGEPPPGCSIRDHGVETVIGASARSASAWGLALAAVFWNSLVSVFLTIAGGGLYSHLVGPLPSWYPVGGSTPVNVNGTSTTVATMSLGMAVFLCVFLTPFALAGAGLIGYTLHAIFGRVEVVIRGSEAWVFTGIGRIGWRRPFDPARVATVQVKVSTWEVNGEPQRMIVMTAERDVKLGMFLPDTRRQWLAGVLRKVLLNP
ncbi:MAG: hypothetical protein JNL50_11480 [Phycisphaerae bacterium]|nr:hypothetical protein [Phycisphaerae bacterium]